MKLIVNGKIRIIRKKYIDYHTDDTFYCNYKNHTIEISKQEIGGFYCKVKNSAGMYVVDGYYGVHYYEKDIKTIKDCLKECIENILI